MELKRNEIVLGAGLLLLLAVAVVRTAVPDRSRLRPLSIQGLDIPNEPIGQGQHLVRDARWSPPTDVYVLGWNYRIGTSAIGTDLILLADDVRLFHMRAGDAGMNPAFFQNGGAYVLRKGQTLTLRYGVTNTGPPGETRGAGALVYFVPVEGN